MGGHSRGLALLRRTPRQLDRIATIVQRGNLQARVRLLADEEDVRTATRLLNRVVLAGLGGLVGLLSVMLLGTHGGPHLTGDTSLSSSSATSACSAPPS